jgi:predicted DNA binding CopG/RHH family protein
MSYYELTEEEQKQLAEVEAGEYKSVNDLHKVKDQAIIAAKKSLNKTMNINIRLSESDVYRLKSRAAKEGLPYQTLAASLLHQAASR